MVQTLRAATKLSARHHQNDSPSSTESCWQDCPHGASVLLGHLQLLPLSIRLAIRCQTTCHSTIYLMLIRGFRLQYAGVRAFDASAQTVLEQEIAGMARAQLKPRLIFWRCVDLLIREKVAVPTYFRLADLILTAINHQKQMLTTMLAHTLSEPTRVLLDGLFVQSPTLDGDPVDSQTAAYKL